MVKYTENFITENKKIFFQTPAFCFIISAYFISLLTTAQVNSHFIHRCCDSLKIYDVGAILEVSALIEIIYIFSTISGKKLHFSYVSTY